jgi:Bacteriophage tail sheath protein
MAQFFSPGVYVQEVPSAVQPIAGVGTSTAGFIGVFPTPAAIPVAEEQVGVGDGRTRTFRLGRYPADTAGNFIVKVGNATSGTASLANDSARDISYVTFATPPPPDAPITVNYAIQMMRYQDEQAQPVASLPAMFTLSRYPVDTTDGAYAVRTVKQLTDAKVATARNVSTVTLSSAPASGATLRADYTVQGLPYSQQINPADIKQQDQQATFQLAKHIDDQDTLKVFEIAPAANAKLANDPGGRLARVMFATPPGDTVEVHVDYQVPAALAPMLATPGEVKLCTNFNEFKQWFGDFSLDMGQRTLAHAVFGFFLNGGSRCYVVREETENDILANATLDAFAAIDEIAIVAAPGIVNDAIWVAIEAHCKVQTGDRFAILDSPQEVEAGGKLDLTKLAQPTSGIMPQYSDYAAFYFPWIDVFDPFSGGRMFVPPSGHMAGIYARVDTQRGVHKAPANEPVLGALGLKYQLSRAQQDGLNPQGVNCIRDLNGNIRVWGARTLGGDANGEWKYVNVRRLFLFLRESIDQGTQWVVFEPNDPSLWAKITRNVNAFLTNVWRAGALFGNTPQEAFYVRCDASTNPPELRDQGQVVTEIGVAVVRPAEFVVFRISQWSGPGQ